MTLEQLFQNNGGTCGFRVRSIMTNNVLEVVSRTPRGKFVLQSITNPEKEESFAKGQVDRYVLATAEVDARRVELEARISVLEGEISVLEDSISAKQNECDQLWNEIDNIGAE